MKTLDDIAADILPIRLIISIAIIAAISVMIAVGYGNLAVTLSEHQVENECRALKSTLYTMVRSGVARDIDEINAGEGTKRSHTFTLPDTLMYLAFGVDPDPDNNGILKTGLTENGSIICYRVEDSSKQVIWFPEYEFEFREGKYIDNKWTINGDGQGFIISSGGKTTITFELIEKSHEIYILVQANDNIEP